MSQPLAPEYRLARQIISLLLPALKITETLSERFLAEMVEREILRFQSDEGQHTTDDLGEAIMEDLRQMPVERQLDCVVTLGEILTELRKANERGAAVADDVSSLVLIAAEIRDK